MENSNLNIHIQESTRKRLNISKLEHYSIILLKTSTKTPDNVLIAIDWVCNSKDDITDQSQEV